MLFKINRILVCTDLTEKSDEVLQNAEILRQRLNAQLDILHVSDIGLKLDWSAGAVKEETYYDAFVQGIVSDIQNKLNAQIKRTQVKGNPIMVEGDVVEKINELIVKGPHKYDLLIIGHNDKMGLFQHMMGSVARKVAASVSIPTIVSKRKFEFENVAAFVDGAGAVDWMITSALDFYRSFSFNKIEFVTLWHDLPEPFKNETLGSERANKLVDEIKYFIRNNETYSIRVEPSKELTVAEHLAHIVELDKINLAVMKRNRGLKLNKMILGSETMRMLDMNSTNILILPV